MGISSRTWREGAIKLGIVFQTNQKRVRARGGERVQTGEFGELARRLSPLDSRQANQGRIGAWILKRGHHHVVLY
jgi:hypothetical protein